MSEAAPELVKVRIDWSAAETTPAHHVNQALGQLGPPGSDGMPDGIYVTIGTVSPPALLDEDTVARDELVARLESSGAKVNVVGQFHMSRQMLQDFIAVLQTTAAKYDAALQLAVQERVRKHGGGSV